MKQFETFDGNKIFYKIVRKKKPFVMFVHGLSGNYSGWEFELNFLEKKGYSTITFDLRGHGNSSIPEKDFSMDAYCRDIFELLKKEKIKKVSLVSHCFGGMISQKFYEKYPSMVSSIALINTTYKNPFECNIPVPKKIQGILKKAASGTSNLLDKTFIKNIKYPRMKCNEFIKYPNFFICFLASMVYTHPKTMLKCQETMMKFNSEKILKKIKVPVLIIGGTADKFFPAKISQEMKCLAIKSELRIIKGKHLTVMKQADEVNKTIFDFFKRNHI
jgi:3-oxoadipate enol-lactonase